MTSGLSHLVYRLLPIALLVLYLAIAPAIAATTLSNVKYMADVVPGATVTYRMSLSSASSDAPADYEIAVLGFTNGPNGNYLGLEPAQDTGAYTARPFITLDRTSVHIAPGAKEDITATIRVPSSGTGGRYALINIHPKTVGSGTVALVVAMNAPIMITLKGTQLTETGVINSISIGEAATGKPVEVTTTFTSTGNHHYYGAKNEIAVMDSAGKEVARTTTTPLVTAIVPDGKVNFTQRIAVSLIPGTYTVDSSMFDSKGAVLDTKSTTFTLSEPGAAAPTQTVSEAPTQTVSAPPTSWNPAAVTTQGGAVVLTPEANPTTYTPLGITTVMLALTVVFGILVMRRRN